MSFSPYTLSGHQFLGGGVELTPPGKFKFSAMYGRLQKRILPDTSGMGEPAYHRIGTGFKTEYSTGFGNIGVSVFYARDDAKSLSFENDSLAILPEENLALGLSGNFSLPYNFTLNFDYSLSLLSENLNSPLSEENFRYMPLFKRRESTRQSHAIKAGINYNSRYGSIGVGVERIDPGYRTLGAYYNNNDFVNYTINYAGAMLQNKVNVAISYGLQHDNLMDQKDQKTTRTVGNINLGIVPVKNLNLALFYSGFNNFTHIKTTFENINTISPYGELDTLDFTQISESMGTSINYRFGQQNKLSHNVNVTFTYQQASQKQGDNPMHAGNKFYTTAGGYNVRIVPLELTPGIMMNYSLNRADSIISEIYGPSLNVRKTFFDKKLNSSLMISYNRTVTDNDFQGENSMLRASAGYNLKKKHTFDLSLVNAWRNNKATGKRRESTLTFTYRYNFNWTPWKKSSEQTKTEIQ